LQRATKLAAETGGGILVITEGVFGMTGDQGKLKEIVELKKKFEDPAEYERQYLAEIEERKKMMIEKQKKWQEGLNKGSKILTNILGLGDDVKRGKYE
jgi:hypothetical protein